MLAILRAPLRRVLDPLGTSLVRAGLSPDVVTVIGTACVVVGSVFLVTRGEYLWGLLVIGLSVLTDMIDGAMARARGHGSRFGAFLDSSCDRIADGAIFGCLAYWLAVDGQRRAAGLALLVLVASLTISYVKARAESIGVDCDVGIGERPERLVVIGIGGLLGGLDVPYGMEATLWLLAVLTVVTIGQRVRHVYVHAQRLDERDRAAAGESRRGESVDNAADGRAP
jgi:CDP-diacylglycerol--glycerol-3-phosphate 3-phosphatidyltransferase